MTISSHIETFAGLPVRAFTLADAAVTPAGGGAGGEAGHGAGGAAGVGPADVAWRIDTDYDGGPDAFETSLSAFLATEWVGQVTALIIGEWGESYETASPIARLVGAADRLTGLRALFLGEMTYEENEISWIKQGDVTPLLTAYPALTVFRVRGADSLELTPLRHESLVELAFESGGLPAAVVRAVGECDLPALRHLELWLGTENYGGDAVVEDLATVLTGARLPSLTYLGLRDSEIADMVAAALAGAPVVARLETLDLSLGALSDVGAAALLSGQPLTHLSTLDVHHHFLTDPMRARLRTELPGVNLDDSDQQEADEGERYISVSE